jgi:hypothetical protein
LNFNTNSMLIWLPDLVVKSKKEIEKNKMSP